MVDSSLILAVPIALAYSLFPVTQLYLVAHIVIQLIAHHNLRCLQVPFDWLASSHCNVIVSINSHVPAGVYSNVSDGQVSTVTSLPQEVTVVVPLPSFVSRVLAQHVVAVNKLMLVMPL
jgi:hypothetical protein